MWTWTLKLKTNINRLWIIQVEVIRLSLTNAKYLCTYTNLSKPRAKNLRPVRGIKRSVSARHGKLMGSMLGRGKLGTWCLKLGLDVRCSDSASMLGTNRVKAKDVKGCTYCCYVRCAILIERVGRMLWPKTEATHIPYKLLLTYEKRVKKYESLEHIYFSLFKALNNIQFKF